MDDVTPRTRRAILGAALGGVAASVAAAFGRPATAEAANGDHVVLGASNTATQNTTVSSNSSLAMTVVGAGQAIQGQGGTAGIQAVATLAHGIGLAGYANYGTSGTGRGVLGISSAPDGSGVEGTNSASSTGVAGFSLAPGELRPSNPNKVGVFGHAIQDSTSMGVYGVTYTGYGVNGAATTGRGVRGSSNQGTGVQGDTSTGIGVLAFSDFQGTALSVVGPAKFNRSGRASVPANQSYVDVTIPYGLASTAFVIATMQSHRTGVWVTEARNNYPSTGKVRIYLNKVASTTAVTIIGWIAIG